MRPAALLLAVSSLAACGGGQTGSGVFSTSWEDDGGKSIEAIRRRLDGHPIPKGADVAVGVVQHSSKLIGQPLAGGAKWSYAHALDARPVITGSVVVGSGGGELFALDALTGKALWTRPTGGLPLHGAGDDGTITVVTMGSGTGHGSTLLAVAHDGSVVRQVERPIDMGAPAVVDRLAFVPWENQYVSVFDVVDGTEIGRVLLREKTSHAWTVGGGLYFGELGIFRFDDKIKESAKGAASHLALPTTALPGRPLLMRPGAELTRPVAGGPDKIRLFVRPTPPGQPLAADGGRFYATYFRLALGVAQDTAHVAWVHTHPTALIGGAVAQGSFVLCDADGKLTSLDAVTGGQIGEAVDMGEPLEACSVQADAFKKVGATAEAGSLIQQIKVALSDRDLELDAGQTLLLRQLGSLPDEAATALLLQIVGAPHTPPAMLDAARAALAGRRVGAPALVASLERRYDFLHDVLTPPPVGAIALALSAMNAPPESGAARVLTSHLFEPADSDKDVRDVAQALAVLATPAEVAELRRFFAMYRAAPPEPEEIPQAVSAVAEALLRIGGPDAKAALISAAAQPSTNPLVRARITALIDAEGAIKH